MLPCGGGGTTKFVITYQGELFRRRRRRRRGVSAVLHAPVPKTIGPRWPLRSAVRYIDFRATGNTARAVRPRPWRHRHRGRCRVGGRRTGRRARRLGDATLLHPGPGRRWRRGVFRPWAAAKTHFRFAIRSKNPDRGAPAVHYTRPSHRRARRARSRNVRKSKARVPGWVHQLILLQPRRIMIIFLI